MPTPEQVAKYTTIRQQIADELPDLIARHHQRMEQRAMIDRVAEYDSVLAMRTKRAAVVAGLIDEMEGFGLKDERLAFWVEVALETAFQDGWNLARSELIHNWASALKGNTTS